MSLVVALLGAECTGKSTLTEQLGERLADLRIASVSEHLRDWCIAHERTPQQHEQAEVASTQTSRIASAARHHPLVLADTTALMTALYSRHYFADERLFPEALQAHRQVHLTLLCCPEGIAWQQDGWLRDGDTTRQRTHEALRQLLQAEGIAFTLLQGPLPARLRNAERLIRGLALRHGSERLDDKDDKDGKDCPAQRKRWHCACCPVPGADKN